MLGDPVVYCSWSGSHVISIGVVLETVALGNGCVEH